MFERVVLLAGYQRLSWTSVISHGAQLSGQTEIQQAQTENTGQASHLVHAVLDMTDSDLNCFLSSSVLLLLLLSGSGADGQRAGQRIGQTDHPGRGREPAPANVEV